VTFILPTERDFYGVVMLKTRARLRKQTVRGRHDFFSKVDNIIHDFITLTLNKERDLDCGATLSLKLLAKQLQK